MQALILPLAGLLVIPTSVAQAASTVTTSFSYTGNTQTFTVPAGVTSLTVTLRGGEGGRGGHDSQGTPQTGGYQGLVTGTVAVTPGQAITVAVGGGGGIGTSSQGSAPGGTAGLNPLPGYDGATGGSAGPAGSSGGGGGGGAASVLIVGSTHIVAGGAGGNGGSGQFTPIVGRRAEETHTARPDVTSTDGRPGLNTALACSPGFNCDGGASGAGGGGAQGGDRGAVQYGGATATEYFGFGGWPGANSIGGITSLSASYGFYSGNSGNGSITISYDDGAPSAPLNLVGTTQNGAVALTWAEPANAGSSPITDYRVERGTGATGPWTLFDDGVSSSTAADVTGLTNGVGYYFRVTAINDVGAGAPAITSVPVTPSDVPARPTMDTVTGFGGGIAVDFTPGATSSPITGYEYRLDGGEWTTGTVAGNRMTISGLMNGRSYSVEIRASNVIGASLASTPAATATPRDVPGAPTALLALAGDETIVLGWAAPRVENGAAVVDYEIQRATSPSGPFTAVTDAVTPSTSATVGGLDNGTTYYVRVAAVNAAGTGPWSAAAVATPFTVPAAPSIEITPADGALAVTITPGSNGGSALTGFEYRIGDSGAWTSTGSLSNEFTISGLTNGASYDVVVRSVNAGGNSAASNLVTVTPRTVPAAPAISAVALDDGAVSVSFTPGADGGSAMTNVQYSINGGTSWITRTPASVDSPLTISGLTGGVTYAVQLRMVNAAGASGASNTSSVTAKGTPDTPSLTVEHGDRLLRLEFEAPANGGSPITAYEYSLDGGEWVAGIPAVTSSPLVIAGLTNGTDYSVRVRAVNAAGNSAPSESVSARPRTVPGAPTIDDDTIVGEDGALDVVFTAPSSDGGSPIIAYEYSTDAGTSWRSRDDEGTTGSPLRISVASGDEIPLVGGEPYPVEIRAVNAAGSGVASAVASGITTTAPLAPVITEIRSGNSSAVVRFTAPANGGAAITGYEYRLDGGEWIDTTVLSTEFTISGLVNSTEYQLELRAINSVGAGAPSEPRSMQVFTRPGVPMLGVVTPGDQQLAVEFLPPTTDGGSPITAYQYSTDGGVTWRDRTPDSTASPLVIEQQSTLGAPALSNGELYAIQLRAVNAAGTGSATETRLVAPRGVPSNPTEVTVSGGNQSLTVDFVAGSDGGSAITAYEYRLGDDGDWVDAGALSSPFTIGGLTNGTEYTVSLRAVNAIGASAGTAPAAGTPRTVPDAPTGIVTSSGSETVTISWDEPASDGGSVITGYTARLFLQAAGGTPVATCSVTTTTCSIADLTNGTTVYADVVALNEAGTGPASEPRSAETPLAAPSVEIASIAPAATSLAVTLDVVDGGAPISAYEYQLDDGEWMPAGVVTNPFTIGGLTTGTEYSVRVRATNDGGTGEPSPAVTAVPHTTPGTPGSLVATSAAGSAVLAWSGPVSNGGQPITDYVVEYATSASGTYTTFADGTSSATSATVTGLSNGTRYYFRVSASNVAGTGAASALASTTPLAAPSAPTIGTVTPGSTFLTVPFTAPASNGGSAITGYQYSLNHGAWQTASGTTSPITITGLTNGTTYGVRLRAVNATGGGDPSASVSAKPYGIPAAVLGFRATPGNGSITLEWDAANDNGSAITQYNVIRWSAATEGSIAAQYTPTTTTQVVTGLSNGTTYYFTIEAVNAAGTGARSAPRTSATPSATTPTAPTAVAITVNDDAATMTWTPGAAGTSAITSYLVQYSTDGTTWTTVKSGSSSASAAFDLASTSIPYELRVAGISASGAGAFATVRPPLASSSSGTATGSASATLLGLANANGATADAAFEYATSAAALGGASDEVVAATPPSVTASASTPLSGSLTGLAPNTTYYARAVATAGSHTAYGRVVSFTTDASIVSSGLQPAYTGDPVVIDAVTVPADLAVERTFVGTGATVYPSSSTPPTAVGTYEVTTTPADDDISGREVAALTILPRDLDLSITAADRPYDGTVHAELAVELAGVVDGDDVAVNDVTGVFADPDAGVDKLVAIEIEEPVLHGADAHNYELTAIPSSTVATITPAEQTLSFVTTPPSPAAVGATYVPIATSSSALPASFSIAESAASVCAFADGAVSLVAPGTCVVVATQPGSLNVEAAEPAEQSFQVYGTQVIGLPGVDDLALGDGPVVLPAETDDGLVLSYVAGPSEVCTVLGSTVSLHGVGTCEVTASQAGDATTLPATESVSFAVTRNAQTIELPAVGNRTVGDGPVVMPSETDDGLPLAYTARPADVCTASGATVTLIGPGMCEVTASQAGDSTHLPAAVTITFTVAPLTVVPPATDPQEVELRMDLALEAGDAAAGAELTIDGEGLKPNSPVRIEMHSVVVVLGTATTDGEGSLHTTVRLPADIVPGEHDIVAVGTAPDGREVTHSVPIFVDWTGSLAVEGVPTGGYVAVTATRILDTRQSGTPLAAAVEYPVAMPAGLVPSDVTAVVINLTVTDPSGAGYITVYPCGAARPLTAAINFTRGQTRANLAETRMTEGGRLCLWANVATHAVIDLQGYHGESGTAELVPRTAVRLVDTRPDAPLSGGATRAVEVIGDGKAPAGSAMVALNVTVDDPAAAGYLTVFPCGEQRPPTSNVNFVRGQTISNEVAVAPGQDGLVCVYSTQATQLVVDLNASYRTGGGLVFSPVVPGRLIDTRLTQQVGRGRILEVPVADGASAVALNVAVTEPEAAGYLTVFPCDRPKPLASNLNFTAGQTISNHVTASVGDDGAVCVYASAATQVVVDVEGIYRER